MKQSEPEILGENDPGYNDQKWRQNNGFKDTMLGDQATGGDAVDGPPGIEGNPTALQISRMQEFDALSGAAQEGKESYITFAGGGEMIEFSHSMQMSSSSSVSIGLDLEGGMAWGMDVGAEINVLALTVGTENNWEWENSESRGESRTKSTSNGRSATVAYTLGDPNPGDKFVVQVTDNKVFGTPFFKTIGGASRCPHEPNTTPREGGVDVTQMLPFCPQPNGLVCADTTDGCPCTNLEPDEWAVYKMKFRVDYTNCILKGNTGKCLAQPKDATFDYKLRLSNTYDCQKAPEGSNPDNLDGKCLPAEPGVCSGADGPAGMVIMIDGVVLGKQEIMLGALPIGEHELLVQVIKGPVCDTHKQIEIVLSSACEYDMMGDMCIMNPFVADDTTDDDLLTRPIEPESACNSIIESSAFIEEISWSSPSRRRTTESIGKEQHLHRTIRKLEDRVLGLHGNIDNKIVELQTTVLLLVGLVSVLALGLVAVNLPRLSLSRRVAGSTTPHPRSSQQYTHAPTNPSTFSD
jgi:hypothetical protein